MSIRWSPDRNAQARTKFIAKFGPGGPILMKKLVRRTIIFGGPFFSSSRVGVFNWGVVWSLWFRYGLELHWCVVCVSGVVNPLPKRQTIRICDGHEDLSSC